MSDIVTGSTAMALELTALRAENERLKKRVEWHEHALHTCHDECDKPLCKATRDVKRLTAEITSLTEEFGIQNNDLGKALLENERLRAALQMYAGPVGGNTFPHWSDGYPGGVMTDWNTLDFGDAARTALEEKP